MYTLKGANCYICGKITGRNPDEVREQFADAYELIKRSGANYAFNPDVEIAHDATHELAMRLCLRQLARSKTMVNGQAEPFYDYLIALPGWTYSDGAKFEVEAARMFGINVIPLKDIEVECMQKNISNTCETQNASMT